MLQNSYKMLIEIMENLKKTLYKNRLTCIVLGICLIIFLSAYFLLRPAKESIPVGGDYAEYENGKVIEILSDNTVIDEVSDNAARGEQMLIVEVTSGQYKGETLQVYNYVGPLYGIPLAKGDACTMIISTYENGDVTGTVYEFNRIIPIIIVIGLFFITTALVGGKNGIKSLFGLVFTILSILCILFPALLKGAPTILTTVLVCAFVALVSLVIIGGIQKKTICAFLGTVSGMLLALLFALFAQWLLRINGLRVADVEPLLQLRQTGTPIGLRGLLSAGVIISSLGAVMDVAMSISSSLQEVHEANTSLGQKDLFHSGMNIGRDMVGTMTNTLILAFIGSGLVLILYIYSLNLAANQFLSSSYLAIEVISGISSSIGVILSVPITTLISSYAYSKQ